MTANRNTIKIELNIYSGRRNPSWELSFSEIEELKQKMKMPLPSAKQKTAPQLGYRGFALINSNGIHDFPELVYVYSGVLGVKNRDTKISYYEDVNNIEQWFISQAHERGYGKTIEEAFSFSNKKQK